MTDVQSLARSALGLDTQEPKPAAAPTLPGTADPFKPPQYTSPEAEAAVHASEEIDRQGRAPTPENVASSFVARHEERQRLANAALQNIAHRAYLKAEETHGFWANVGWQAAAAGKEIGDGFASAADLLYHTARGVGGMFTGRGFKGGWEDLSQENRFLYGQSSPSILDIFAGPGEHAGLKGDDLLNRRLGESAAIGKGIGVLGSFLIPGGPSGKIAQGAVKPLAGMVERAAVRAAEGVGAGGDAWLLLAKSPGMQRVNNVLDASLRLAGRGTADLMTTGADAIARAYTVAPEGERMQAAKSAAALAPFMVPVARIGQFLGRKVLERGIDRVAALRLKDSYEQFASGQIGVDQFQKALASEAGIGWRGASKIVTDAFEGTAFTGMQPGAFDTLQKALAGDRDAQVKLRSEWLGNVLGTALIKMVPGTPIEEAPFFRRSRPDLNKLETYLDAEAAKRVLAQKAEKPIEPSPVPTPEDIRNQGEIAAREAEAKRTAGTQAATEAALNAPVRDKSEIAETEQRQQAYDEATAEERALVQERLNMRARYGWAQDPTAPLLRASWHPEFHGDTADVRLTYGRDHVVDLHEGGALTMNAATAGVLRQFGVEPEARDVLSPDRIRVQGAAAKKALDDLALIGVIRRMQGDSLFEKMGLREQEPGIWVDGNGNRRQMQLDGDSVTSRPDGKWTGTDSHMVIGRDAEKQVWDHPTLEALNGWLMQKKVLHPDPIVDELVGQVIDRARFGENLSANELRRLLSNFTPDELVNRLGSGTDREVGFLVGGLAAGHGHAESATAELRKAMGDVTVGSNRGTSEASMLGMRRSAQQGEGALPDVPREGDAGVAEEASAGGRGEAPGERSQLREGLPATGETGAEAVPGVRGEGADAPRGLQQAVGGDVAVPEAPSGAPRERSLSDLLREIQPGDTAEAGSMNPLGPKTRAAAKKGGRGAGEFLLETQPEVLRKAVPGEQLPYQVRRVVAEGEQLGDVLTAEFRPGWEAIRTRARDVLSKEERQSRRATRTNTIQSPTTPEAAYMRWRLLADGKVAPQNAREQAFVDAYQKAGRMAYEEQRRAGAVRAYPQEKGEPKYESLRPQERSVVPYRFTREFAELMQHPDTRRDTFEMLARENPDGTMPQYVKKTAPLKVGEAPSWEYRGEGKVTADALEALFQKEMQGEHVDSALRESAAEHFRMLRNVPDVWKGIQILETDPFKAITGGLRSQGQRAATLRQFGPDIPLEARRAMLEEATAREKAEPGYVASPAVEALRSGRLGVRERLGRFQEALTQSRALAGRNPETVMQIARDLMVRIQGGQPEKLWDLTQSQMVQDFLGLTSAGLASKGFVWDLLEPILRTGAYRGYWKSAVEMMRLFNPVTGPRNFREAARMVDRMGAAERAVSDHILDDAMSNPMRTAAQIASLPGSLSERAKQVYNAKVANDMVEEIRDGQMSLFTRQILQDELRLSPEDMQRIDQGRMDEGLATQLRRELATLFSSRGTRAEGSRYAASRNAGLITRFNRFATRRLEQTVKNVTAVALAAKRGGWASKETATAMLRMARVQGGMALGGLAGQAISYMLTSALQGENPLEGAARVLRELTYAPVHTLLKAYGMQALGGPLGQLANAVVNNNDTKSWAGLTIPTQLGKAIADFGANTYEKFGKNDWAGAGQGLLDAAMASGAVPFRGDVAAMFRAVAAKRAGEDPQTVADAQIVREWKRFEGIQDPFSQRNKPDAFYDSIGKVLQIANGMPKDPPKAIVKKAMDDLKVALGLAPEESVAASIEGHMVTKGLTDEQDQKLREWLGDPDRIKRVYQHDNAMMELAREVRKLEGTYPTPFQQQLEQVRQQSALGRVDRWHPMMQRAVDEAHQRLLAGDGVGTDIQDLATAMSIHGAQVAPLFPQGMRKYLASEDIDSTAKARRIAAVLRGRAYEQRAKAIADQARERRAEAQK